MLLKGRAVLKPDPDLTTVPLKTLLGLPSAYRGKSGLLVWPFRFAKAIQICQARLVYLRTFALAVFSA